ncbi:hypothetical protein [Rubritalea tangerina]|uniref:Alpha-galactosidase n=1 Tax=Rubritalea tangerina TaxID=430798 RepID=A0ABW4Z9A7_9BACT
MKYTIATLTCIATLAPLSAKQYSLENASLKRVLSTDGKRLQTLEIQNKAASTTLKPSACAEFLLRISQGTDKPDTDITLTADDFTVVEVTQTSPQKLVCQLENKQHGLKVKVVYTLNKDDFYARKHLEITSSQNLCLERVDIDALSLADAYQPYQISQINARGPWRPGLGQPLFTKESATFWGVEFPAAVNTVQGEKLRCGYLHGRFLKPGVTYTSYASVVGVSDDPDFNADAFYDYINEIRVRPLRLQTQYNSWFDYGRNINENQFVSSVDKVNQELCVERGVPPLRCYVIDDGWQDSTAQSDWSDKVWKVNQRFDNNFTPSEKAVANAKSTLGLWLSPGCNFNARPIVPSLRAKGMGGLKNYMSLADTPYMDMLEQRMVELTKKGVTYFKLDGTFGHLHTRDFDIHGKAHGVPEMPQLDLDGLTTDDKRLNDSKYDELKTYYLTVGSERMMKIFKEMGAANPEVYIVISNGAYLSPWWMMHCDAVWMINAGDAAGGANRTGELVYRDEVYHNIWVKENTHYPMNSLFNHEPKKKRNHETKDTFRKYLYMNMSRGTGFVELYLKTFNLAEYDWDVLAEGMLWVHDVFPTFARSRMHGGRPKAGEVYGYTAWNDSRGYVSLHNPSNEAKSYTFTLDRKFGLQPAQKSYHLSSPLSDSLKDLEATYQYGDTITLTLDPAEIRILNFDPNPRTWSKLKALQTRTKDDYIPKPNKQKKPSTISHKGHKILGKWNYLNDDHSREFTADGKCILRKGEKVIWSKPFVATDAKTIIVEGKYKHTLTGNTLTIEGKYKAKK